jgi:acetyl esterase
MIFPLLLAAQSTFANTEEDLAQPPPDEVYALASDGTPLTWVVYTPQGRGPWPAVLVIHGGNFFGGDPNEPGAVTCAHDLADAGYIAFSINYRLAPPGSLPGQNSLGRFPDQYDDVHLAVQAARDDSRSTGKVGAVGGSSGASHAVWVSTTGTRGADRLDVAVGLSGAYDYSDFSPDPALPFFIQTVTNYVGVRSTDIADLRAASPAWAVTRTVAPLFLVDSIDDLMPAVQLDDMVAHLSSSGARNYEAMSIPGNFHSFANWPAVKDDALNFLASYLNDSGH